MQRLCRYFYEIGLAHDLTSPATAGRRACRSYRLLHHTKPGRLATLTYPDGTIVTRDHTARGRLDEVLVDLDGTGGGSPVSVASFDYDDGNREIERTFGNSLLSQLGYVTGDNLVEDITVTGKPVLSLGYVYDANKNLSSETYGSGAMSGFSFTNDYDDENRLIEWDRSNGDAQDWDLSLVGDWDEWTKNTVSQTRTHSNAHEITAAGGSAAHDAKGSMTARPDGRQFRRLGLVPALEAVAN